MSPTRKSAYDLLNPVGCAQASEVLWPRHPFWLRWGSYTCPQCWHQWPAEGVETTSWSPSSNMATHHREWPQTSEPGTVVGPAQSLWPWSVAWYRGNGDVPACCMLMMTLTRLHLSVSVVIHYPTIRYSPLLTVTVHNINSHDLLVSDIWVTPPNWDFGPLAMKCTECRGSWLFLESEHSVTPVQLYAIVCQHPSRPQQILHPSAGSKKSLLIKSSLLRFCLHLQFCQLTDIVRVTNFYIVLLYCTVNLTLALYDTVMSTVLLYFVHGH